MNQENIDPNPLLPPCSKQPSPAPLPLLDPLQSQLDLLKSTFLNWRTSFQHCEAQYKRQIQTLSARCTLYQNTLKKLLSAFSQLTYLRDEFAQTQGLLDSFSCDLEDSKRKALAQLEYFSFRNASLQQHSKLCVVQKQQLLADKAQLQKKVLALQRLLAGRGDSQQVSATGHQNKQTRWLESRVVSLQLELQQERRSRQERQRTNLKLLKRVVQLEQAIN